jgi:predicted hotdog family 3-hydroxylacyl-ACP dehydratase
MTPDSSAEALQQFAGMPASQFVLHRAPLLLLDRLVEPGAEVTVCEWRVRGTDAFVSAGHGVPAYVGVEYMAQCVAVHAGVRARARGSGPPLGFLLGTRHYRTTVEYFKPNLTYRATCRELISDENGMGSYECCILLDHERIAEGRLAVLQKEEGTSPGE